MKRALIGAAVLAAGATVVLAQAAVSPAIKERKDLMKSVGAAAKEPGAMARGEAAFDLAKVQASLKVYAEATKKLPDLYPDNSKSGGDTAALPAIWEKKAEFVAIYAKLNKDAQAAATAIKDEASFKAEWPKVMGNCGTCHKAFKADPPKK